MFRLTDIEGCEHEIWQVPSQLGIAGRLLVLSIGFARVKL
jgi:hypothetical protein